AHATLLQDVEQLDALVDRHTEVLLAVDDQGRRIEVAGTEVRRVALEDVGVLPELPETAPACTVVGGDLGKPVEHGGVRNQRLEGVFPSQDGGVQVAAVTAATGGHAFRVDPR